MKKSQKIAIYISILAIVFFFALSAMTRNWGFFLWSLFPVFLILMTTIFIKPNKRKGVE
ncbi:hypothetical protein [Planococcus massiliensis]|uniref:hypothetical protein n=1 Tax=Planococcus massiliensis TaxID=1499687 RepID=UPI0018FE4A89|nr:hypothetical protein [Planococcus massiliensis]